jgi:anti-sigma regulatory factor (Ser/Thr protein kinase)
LVALTGQTGPEAEQADGYRHEAFLYQYAEEFFDVTLDFVREGVEREEPMMVVLAPAKIATLRCELQGAANAVRFVDMDKLSRNPARIIPAWQDFVSEHAGQGRRLRGIGEPIVPAQDEAMRAEAHRHEALLNLPFSGEDLWMLCPYDVSTLQPEVIDEARRNHPFAYEGGRSAPSGDFSGSDVIVESSGNPLLTAPGSAAYLEFDEGTLVEVRLLVFRQGVEAGLRDDRIAEFVIAANEIATNSIRYGGKSGKLRVWAEAGWFVCEFSDEGQISDPLAGRVRPSAHADGGRGLWIANQICDLVQIRVTDTGSVVRIRHRIEPPA